MAKVQKRRKGARKKLQAVPEAELPQRLNYIILVAGIAVVFLGILVMSMGDAVSPLSVTVAPIILFIGYCVVIPVGIIMKPKKSGQAAG
ncbi:MAG: hypothetical protein JXA28_08835 [Bacteroidetes bacterium]|nr:hypothetical protein [Bacteroidota bacterium]